MITRGDIYFIKAQMDAVGSEQKGKRPAVIVSNNKGNECAPVVEVVYLTGMRKKNLPTQVKINAIIPSTAMCEQIDTIDKERLIECIGHISKTEQQEIDRALRISLGLEKM